MLSILGLGVILCTIRQSQTAAARARRFYRQLKQHPSQTLVMLENRYPTTGSSTRISADAGQSSPSGWRMAAHQSHRRPVFAAQSPGNRHLLITHALSDIAKKSPPGQGGARWVATFRTAQALLQAPSIAELSLLQPQLVELRTCWKRKNGGRRSSIPFCRLLTNLRDSERVDRKR
ncbi:MAG: hypothetical protein IPK53_07485 [bacterium]|nr:hypothetical protein [bacterium]